MARLLYRLGRFSARHRVIMMLSWALTLVVLAVVTMTGMRFSDGGFEIPGTESSKALAVVEDEFPDMAAQPGAGSLQLVLRVDDGQEITNTKYTSMIGDVRAELSGIDHVETVSNPFDPTQPYVSPDLDTAVITLGLTEVTDQNAERITDEVLEVAHDLRDAGVATVEVGGHIGSNVPEILGPSEIVGVAIAFLVLVLTFGSLIAAGANMLGAIAGVGVGILGVLAISAINPIGSITPILAVMLGLAVSIDYGLFVLARYRAELRHGKSVEEAVGIAVGTAGSSVVFAGVTVIIALVGLSVVNIPFITEMGLAGALAVLVSIVMAITLLPALMRTMGYRALPRKERASYGSTSARSMRSNHVATDSATTSTSAGTRIGFLERWAALVVKHPVVSVVGAVAVLAVLAVPVLSMKTSLSTPGGEDPESSQRAAYTVVADEFGDGVQSPLLILAEGEGIEAKIPGAISALKDVEGVDAVIPAGVNSVGDAMILTVIPDSGPVDARTKQLVHDIREAEVADVALRVTGETAIGIDVDEKLSDALILYIVLIVSLSLILLMIMFRSILVPLIATGGFLLSLGAGLGVTVAVFQWGWFEALFAAPLGNPMLSLLPILIVGILFGLAMDYQVFLVSRMHEAYAKGLSPKEAILDGFGRTAFVVVAAATIMAAVFGGFALSPSSLVASIALALAAGVVADAFIVRMIIVPAVLSLLGRAAWWMPRWLQKVLPHLDTEGQALEKPHQ